ncbi:MAG TPA: chromate transporter [Steroidobacteraceae bacterium]|nr:chromate transporter [Steroidobacteraceae bacterium]
MDRSVLALLLVFAPLSILSIGGGQATIPEMQHQAVVVHSWLSNGEFADLFALSRAAPGPSSLIAALIGWHVFGFWGAVAATLGMFLPSSLLMYAVGAWWHRSQDSRLRRAIERGLTPIAVGLVFAGAITILRAAHAGALVLATAGAVCLLQSATRISTHATVGAVTSIYLLIFYFT